MAVVGTAYVRIKALANEMARDIEDSLQPLAQKMQSSGREAGKNFIDNFNSSVEDGESKSDFNPAEGIGERVQPELDDMKKRFKDTENDLIRQNKTNLDRLADNFKITGRRASNNFIQNFGIGMWFQLIHRLYDLFLFITPAIGVAGGAITQLVGGLYSMIGVMGPVVNLAGVLPGLFYTLAGSAIAVSVGLKDSAQSAGLGFQAMKAVATGADDADKKMKKYQESLKGLGPEARKFTETLVGMSGQFLDISSNIQSALLPNLTKALEKLQSNGIIDAFGRSFEGLALQAGRTALKMAELSDSPVFRGHLATVFESTNKTAGILGNSLVNVVKALVNVAAAAAPLTEEFARWIETVTGNWATKSTENFKGLQDAMYRGRDAMLVLKSVVSNLWGTLTGLGKAGYDAGMDLWKAFDGVTQKWNEFVNSVEGQKSLRSFFDDSARGTKALGNAFRELGSAMADWAKHENTLKALEGLGPMIDRLGDMILRMVDEAGPALGEMIDSLLNLLDILTEGQGVSAFAKVITVFADALSGLLSLPGGHHILIFFATLVGIFKASSIVAQVTGFRGAVSGLLKTASNFQRAGSMKNWFRGITVGTDSAGRSVKKFNSGFFGGMARLRDVGRTTFMSVGKGFSNLGKSIANTNIGSSMKTVAGKMNPAPLIAKTRTIGSSAGKSMAQGMSTAGAAMTSSANKAASSASGAFSRMGTEIKNTAVSAGKGMSSAMGTAARKTGSAFSKAGRGIKSGFGKTMGLISKLNPFGLIITAIEILLPLFVMLYSSSESFRNAVDGAFSAAKNAVEPLIPIFKDLVSTISDVFSGIMEKVGPPIMDAFSTVSKAVGPILGDIGKTVGEVFSTLGPTIEKVAGSIGPALGNIWKAAAQVYEQLGPTISQVLDQLGPIAEQLGPVLGNAFSELSGAVGELVPVLMELVGSVFSQLGPVIAAVLPLLGELVGSIVSLASEAFSLLAPVITNLVSSVIPPLMTAFGAIVELVVTIVSTVLPPLINMFSTVLPAALNLLIPVITAVINAIVPIITSIIEVLTGVITFITGVFTGNWSMAWEGIKGIFSGVWNLLVAVVTGAVQIIATVVQGWMTLIGGFIRTVWTGIANFFTGIWSNITATFTSVLSYIVNWVMAQWNQMRANTQTVFIAIRTVIANIMNGIRGFISGVLTAIVNFFVGRWNQIRAITSSVFNAVRSIISGALNGARSIVSSVISRIVGIVQGAWGRVRGVTSSAWGAFRSIVSSGVNGAVGVVRSLPGRVYGALSGMASKMRGIGSDMIRGLIGGIQSMAGEVARKASQVVSNAVNAAKRALKIKSPSRVFMEIGAYTGEGLAIGIENTGSRVASASQAMAESVTRAFQESDVAASVSGDAQRALSDGNEALRRSIEDRGDIAKSLLETQKNMSMASALSGPDLSLFGTGADTIRTLADGMRSQEEALRVQAQRTADIITSTLSSSMRSAQASVSVGAVGGVLDQSIPTDFRAPVPPLQVTPDSATMAMNNSDFNPVLTPQNQALVKALSEYVGTTNTNYFNIQKDRSIKELAVEISREMERTK